MRTAGFNSVDLYAMRDSTKVFSIVLMFIEMCIRDRYHQVQMIVGISCLVVVFQDVLNQGKICIRDRTGTLHSINPILSLYLLNIREQSHLSLSVTIPFSAMRCFRKGFFLSR